MPRVDLLPGNVKLGLLGPEELPGIDFTETEAPVLRACSTSGGHRPPAFHRRGRRASRRQGASREFRTSAAGNGNEDTNDVAGDNLSAPPGNDEDIHGDYAITQKQFSGELAGLLDPSSGAPFTFFANGAADGEPVLTEGGVQITSIGDKVVWEVQGPNEIWGVTVPDGGDGGDFERPSSSCTLTVTVTSPSR